MVVTWWSHGGHMVVAWWSHGGQGGHMVVAIPVVAGVNL